MQGNATLGQNAAVMSVRAAAARINESAWNTRNLVTSGELVGVQQVGDGFRRLLITEESVNALLAKRKEQSTAEAA